MSSGRNADGQGADGDQGKQDKAADKPASGKGKPGDFKRVPAKNQLAQSTKKSNNAPDLKTAVQRAEQQKEKFKDSFLAELDRLVGSLTKLPGADGRSALTEESRQEAYQYAHELRGQGGSFGFPLATLVADSLCKVLENPNIDGTKRTQLLALHVQALERIRSERLSGEGGELGGEFRQLIAQMESYHP